MLPTERERVREQEVGSVASPDRGRGQRTVMKDDEDRGCAVLRSDEAPRSSAGRRYTRSYAEWSSDSGECRRASSVRECCAASFVVR